MHFALQSLGPCAGRAAPPELAQRTQSSAALPHRSAGLSWGGYFSWGLQIGTEVLHRKPMQQTPKMRAVLRKRMFLSEKARQKSSLCTDSKGSGRKKWGGGRASVFSLRGRVYRNHG